MYSQFMMHGQKNIKLVAFYLFPPCVCIRKMFRSKSGFIWTYLILVSLLNTLQISVCCYRNSKPCIMATDYTIVS